MVAFSKEDTFNKVANVIADKLSIDKKRVTPDATLTDLGADSLDVVEIIMKMEDQFGIEINDEEAEQLQNIDQVINYVHQKRTK